MPWLDRDVIAEPDPYPGRTRTVGHWRQTYIDRQEAIYGIRHLSVAGRILKDDAILDKARSWLPAVADWDVHGPTSRGYSVSHSDADQNAFLLYAYGEDLAIQSGYYVAFGSDMHLNWRRQAVSKNALLINGKAQYAGID